MQIEARVRIGIFHRLRNLGDQRIEHHEQRKRTVVLLAGAESHIAVTGVVQPLARLVVDGHQERAGEERVRTDSELGKAANEMVIWLQAQFAGQRAESLDEVLLVKFHDSDHSKAWSAPHTSFRDPGVHNAPPRESIEFRTIAYFL